MLQNTLVSTVYQFNGISFNEFTNKLKFRPWIGNVQLQTVYDIYDENGNGFFKCVLIPVYTYMKSTVQYLGIKYNQPVHLANII
jgi:hypothetical protein